MPKTILINTTGAGLTDITRELHQFLTEKEAQNGLLNIFIQHTSASLTIQENADPDVCADLVDHFARLAPEDAPYRHTAEGPDDMPAHIKSVLSDTSLNIPVADGALLLGTWQGVYVFEHRRAPHRRQVVLSFVPAN